MHDLSPPVVGLIGQLSERIDLDALNAIADAGFSLLIVGPLDPRWEQRRFKELTSRSHVHYAGPVPANAIPSYLAAIDVGITPYRDTPFNRASFPLKTLEYLGAGVPVVSTDLPAARWLREDLTRGEHAAAADQILALARSNGEFVDVIGRIAAGEHPDEKAAWSPDMTVIRPEPINALRSPPRTRGPAEPMHSPPQSVFLCPNPPGSADGHYQGL